MILYESRFFCSDVARAYFSLDSNNFMIIISFWISGLTILRGIIGIFLAVLYTFKRLIASNFSYLRLSLVMSSEIYPRLIGDFENRFMTFWCTRARICISDFDFGKGDWEKWFLLIRLVWFLFKILRLSFYFNSCSYFYLIERIVSHLFYKTYLSIGFSYAIYYFL